MGTGENYRWTRDTRGSQRPHPCLVLTAFLIWVTGAGRNQNTLRKAERRRSRPESGGGAGSTSPGPLRLLPAELVVGQL